MAPQPVHDRRLTLCVIVHYGEADLTSRAIESVNEGSTVPETLIVVDNGPGSFVWSRDGYPRADVITAGANLGFAGGVALALASVDLAAYDFVWLLNNDATASRTALESLLLSAALLEDRVMVSSLVIDETSGVPWFERARFIPWRLEGRHERGDPRTGVTRFDMRPSALSVPYLPGCSLLIPVALLREVGGFDPTFFLYGEDVDLCLRARRLGWGLALDHSSIVVHRSSSGTTVAARERLMAAMSLLIVARYYPWVVPVALPVALLTAVKRAVGRNQPWLISSRLLGYADQLLAWLRPRYDSERFPSIR